MSYHVMSRPSGGTDQEPHRRFLRVGYLLYIVQIVHLVVDCSKIAVPSVVVTDRPTDRPTATTLDGKGLTS